MTSRDEQIEVLVAKDIRVIKEDLENGDTSYIEAILTGDGWTQYSKMTDAEVAEEYLEAFGPVK